MRGTRASNQFKIGGDDVLETLKAIALLCMIQTGAPLDAYAVQRQCQLELVHCTVDTMKTRYDQSKQALWQCMNEMGRVESED